MVEFMSKAQYMPGRRHWKRYIYSSPENERRNIFRESHDCTLEVLTHHLCLGTYPSPHIHCLISPRYITLSDLARYPPPHCTSKVHSHQLCIDTYTHTHTLLDTHYHIGIRSCEVTPTELLLGTPFKLLHIPAVVFLCISHSDSTHSPIKCTPT